MIYLDYNATSPLRPGVKAAMEALGDAPLNPSSMHAAGRAAKKQLEDARAVIASALSAFPNEVLFTSSATEANNMVLRGFAGTHTLLVSAIEHASITKTASLLGGAVIPVDANGIVKLDVLEEMLVNLCANGEAGGVPSPLRGGLGRGASSEADNLNAPPSNLPPQGGKASPARPLEQKSLSGVREKKNILISVMLANNETGAIQPIAQVAALARKYGALIHCDAVQGLGKIPLDWGLLGVDMLTLTTHKAGGPVGAAALLIRNDLPIKPLLTGGGQELGRRAGTDNVRTIVGFAQAVKEVTACGEAAQWLEWREWLERELVNAAPEAQIIGASGDAGSASPLAGEATRLNERSEFSRSGEGVLSEADKRHAPLPSPPRKGEGIPPASPSRLPQTLCITMPGVRAETQLMNFDLAGFAVSAGSACSSGRIAASPTLQAMGIAPEIAECALRISWGWATTREEIEAFSKAWKAIAQRLGRKAA